MLFAISDHARGRAIDAGHTVVRGCCAKVVIVQCDFVGALAVADCKEEGGYEHPRGENGDHGGGLSSVRVRGGRILQHEGASIVLTYVLQRQQHYNGIGKSTIRRTLDRLTPHCLDSRRSTKETFNPLSITKPARWGREARLTFAK